MPELNIDQIIPGSGYEDEWMLRPPDAQPRSLVGGQMPVSMVPGQQSANVTTPAPPGMRPFVDANQPTQKPMSEGRRQLQGSGLSNALASAAAAIGPNSWGGRLGERTLDMNQRNFENLMRTQQEDIQQGRFDIEQQIADEERRNKQGIIRSLTEPGAEGRSLLEKQYEGDPQRQQLALANIGLGDMKEVESILGRPAAQFEMKAIGDAFEAVDHTKPVDDQRGEFVGKVMKSGMIKDKKTALDFAKLLIPEKTSHFGSAIGKQVEDRNRLVQQFGEDSSEVEKFDEMSQSKEQGTFKTEYGPEGQTKETWMSKGQSYTPEKGWSLTAPKSHAIPASKVKQDMDMIKNQISSKTGLSPFEFTDNPEVQTLLLEAQEMFEEGKGPKEVWQQIADKLPAKQEQKEEKHWWQDVWHGIKRGLGMESEEESGDVRVVAPNGQTGTIPKKQLEEALKSGYKRVE